MPLCCGKKKAKKDAAQPPPPSVVVAQPQPGVREELARVTTTTTAAASTPAAAVQQPPPPVKSEQKAEKVVRKPKKKAAPVKLKEKKPVVTIGETRVEPGELHRSSKIVTQPTQRAGDDDGRTSETDTRWSTYSGHLPESSKDSADAAVREGGTGLRSLSDAERAPDSEAATTCTTCCL